MQNVVGVTSPAEEEFVGWLEHAAEHVGASGEVTLRLVGEGESRALNSRFRGRDAPTNVLSFPAGPAPDIPACDYPAILGDIVICAPLVAIEASHQGKREQHHWVHLVVHGVLHLAGYDHEQGEREAEDMEALERVILAQLGIPDPYREGLRLG
ncbi:rRNA maturation RNase YbeY [Halorhodospira halochloris]|nr:rRNA maturation RNase YbeY [Halorhodospira halochloris]